MLFRVVMSRHLAKEVDVRVMILSLCACLQLLLILIGRLDEILVHIFHLTELILTRMNFVFDIILALLELLHLLRITPTAARSAVIVVVRVTFTAVIIFLFPCLL